MEEKELTFRDSVDKLMNRIKKDIKKFNIIFWIIYISFCLLYLFFMNVAFPKIVIPKYLIFFAWSLLFGYFRVVCKNIIIETDKKEVAQKLEKLVSIETFVNELKTKNRDYYIRIEIGEELVKYAEDKLLTQIAAMRKSVCLNLGYIIPLIRMADNSNLKSNECRIYVRGNIKNTLYLDTSAETVMEPLINETKRICISCCDEIIENKDIIYLINKIEDENRKTYILNKFDIAFIKKVYANLIKEEISLNYYEKFFDLIDELKFDNVDYVSEKIRENNYIRAQITNKFTKDNEIKGYELSDEVTDLIKNAKTHKEELEITNKFKAKLNSQEENIIICEKEIRLKLYRMINEIFPKTSIIAYSEILKNIQINIIDIIY